MGDNEVVDPWQTQFIESGKDWADFEEEEDEDTSIDQNVGIVVGDWGDLAEEDSFDDDDAEITGLRMGHRNGATRTNSSPVQILKREGNNNARRNNSNTALQQHSATNQHKRHDQNNRNSPTKKKNKKNNKDKNNKQSSNKQSSNKQHNTPGGKESPLRRGGTRPNAKTPERVATPPPRNQPHSAGSNGKHHAQTNNNTNNNNNRGRTNVVRQLYSPVRGVPQYRPVSSSTPAVSKERDLVPSRPVNASATSTDTFSELDARLLKCWKESKHSEVTDFHRKALPLLLGGHDVAFVTPPDAPGKSGT